MADEAKGRVVNFEGKTHTFPPDATDDEIRQALESKSSSGRGSPAPAGEKPGFDSSLLDGVKQGPANLQGLGNTINRWVTTNPMKPGGLVSDLGNMTQQTIDMGKDAGKHFGQGDVIGGTRRALNTGINAVAPGLGAQSEDAGKEFEKGNTAAGFGKTAAVGINTALGIATPKIARGTAGVISNLPAAARSVGPAITAAAPSVLGGGGLIAAGELLSQVPGMQYPARIGLGFPGATMIGRGLKQGAVAARDAFNGPSIAPPESPPVTPYEPFRPSKAVTDRMKFGGPVKPDYQPGPSGGGIAARRPGGLPDGGIGPRRVEVQHFGDMRINGRTPEPAVYAPPDELGTYKFGRPLKK